MEINYKEKYLKYKKKYLDLKKKIELQHGGHTDNILIDGLVGSVKAAVSTTQFVANTGYRKFKCLANLSTIGQQEKQNEIKELINKIIAKDVDSTIQSILINKINKITFKLPINLGLKLSKVDRFKDNISLLIQAYKKIIYKNNIGLTSFDKKEYTSFQYYENINAVILALTEKGIDEKISESDITNLEYIRGMVDCYCKSIVNWTDDAQIAKLEQCLPRENDKSFLKITKTSVKKKKQVPIQPICDLGTEEGALNIVRAINTIITTLLPQNTEATNIFFRILEDGVRNNPNPSEKFKENIASLETIFNYIGSGQNKINVIAQNYVNEFKATGINPSNSLQISNILINVFNSVDCYCVSDINKCLLLQKPTVNPNMPIMPRGMFEKKCNNFSSLPPKEQDDIRNQEKLQGPCPRVPIQMLKFTPMKFPERPPVIMPILTPIQQFPLQQQRVQNPVLGQLPPGYQQPGIQLPPPQFAPRPLQPMQGQVPFPPRPLQPMQGQVPFQPQFY